MFIHPCHPLIPLLMDVPGPLVDYPFDTTRNAVHMVFNGVVLDNHPNVKIIPPHAGGFLPYTVSRICLLQSELFEPQGPSSEELQAKFKRFYFDTTLSSGPHAAPSFLAFADRERVLFGSDYPYAPASVAGQFTEMLDNDGGLTDQQKAGFNHGNAKKLFPRLA